MQFETLSAEKMNTMLDLNIRTLTTLSSLFSRDNRDKEGTQIINVSSIGGYAMYQGAVTYCATKFYVASFTEGLSYDLEASGAKMKAKVLAPAVTKTEFFHHATNENDSLNGEDLDGTNGAKHHTMETNGWIHFRSFWKWQSCWYCWFRNIRIRIKRPIIH